MITYECFIKLQVLIDKTFYSNKKECSNAKLHQSYHQYICGSIENLEDACYIIKLDFDKQRENQNERRRIQAQLKKVKVKVKKM